MINNHLIVPLPLSRILSSKVALKAPSGVLTAFLICPRMPLTVRKAAPSNRPTSNAELNMPCAKDEVKENVYNYATCQRKYHY